MIFLLFVGFIILGTGYYFFQETNEEKAERFYAEHEKLFTQTQKKQTKEEYIKEFVDSEKRFCKKVIVVGIAITLISLMVIVLRSSDTELPSWWHKSPDELTDEEYGEYEDYSEWLIENPDE